MTAHLQKALKEVDGLSLHYHGDVAIIVMDRGENRINTVFMNAFNELLDQVESTNTCKGLITTGKGKFYSNGLDLKFISTLTDEEQLNFFHSFISLMRRLVFLPFPTMAAMNGHAYAGGALIACTHDLRTMNLERGWFCFNEVLINRQFGKFNLSLAEAKLGKGRNYTDCLVLAKRYTAQEAMQSGIVHAIQPRSTLLQESMRVLRSFYEKGYPRESLQLMKNDVYRDVQMAYDSEMEDLERAMEALKGNDFRSKL